MKALRLQLLGVLVFAGVFQCQARSHYSFVVEETPYTRLCSTKNILTVNGEFPGPTIYARTGDTVVVDVYNKGSRNITIHWHGVRQPRNPWSDGPAYITQCPIQPGAKFRQKIIFSTEEGTLWWHAHHEWDRATVHGAIIIYPKNGTNYYPFSKPYAEFPIILGEWWKQDIVETYNFFLQSGGDPIVSDAFTINGLPGYLYPCSSKPTDTFKLQVDLGKTYLFRLVNAAMHSTLVLAITNHTLTVVGSDASYTKPFITDYIHISPGQTIDVLFTANQNPNHLYHMAAKIYSPNPLLDVDETTTTAIIHYKYNHTNTTNIPTLSPSLIPKLPSKNDTVPWVRFTSQLRSLANQYHPIDVPLHITTPLFFTLSLNTFPCPFHTNTSCQGPNGTRISASVNNMSFVTPTSIDILKAYYYHINGEFGVRFPSFPPLKFNFTGENPPLYLQLPKRGIELKVVEYMSNVEIVFQGTRLFEGSEHPMHLHGFNFYMVGWGFGNFNEHKDPLKYNLIDPPLQNTVTVPINGWMTIRFKADNPGIWFMHCHFERHHSWGMNMAFIVKNGKTPNTHVLTPPPDMPPC